MHSLVPRPSNAGTSSAPQLQKRGNEKRTGRVWKITMPRSVLTAGMLPHVLMRERTSVQPISVRVKLMTGSKYTVEHRNLKIGVVKDQSFSFHDVLNMYPQNITVRLKFSVQDICPLWSHCSHCKHDLHDCCEYPAPFSPQMTMIVIDYDTNIYIE